MHVLEQKQSQSIVLWACGQALQLGEKKKINQVKVAADQI